MNNKIEKNLKNKYANGMNRKPLSCHQCSLVITVGHFEHLNVYMLEIYGDSMFV